MLFICLFQLISQVCWLFILNLLIFILLFCLIPQQLYLVFYLFFFPLVFYEPKSLLISFKFSIFNPFFLFQLSFLINLFHLFYHFYHFQLIFQLIFCYPLILYVIFKFFYLLIFTFCLNLFTFLINLFLIFKLSSIYSISYPIFSLYFYLFFFLCHQHSIYPFLFFHHVNQNPSFFIIFLPILN